MTRHRDGRGILATVEAGVVELSPYGRGGGPLYPAALILCLLITWQCKEPVNHQLHHPWPLWWEAFQRSSHGGERIHHSGVCSGWRNIWHSSTRWTNPNIIWGVAILPDSSLPLYGNGIGGVMVEFYYIYQSCSCSSGWRDILDCVSISVLGFN